MSEAGGLDGESTGNHFTEDYLGDYRERLKRVESCPLGNADIESVRLLALVNSGHRYPRKKFPTDFSELAYRHHLALLVLTRRPGEKLIIELPTGEQVEVTVLG